MSRCSCDLYQGLNIIILVRLTGLFGLMLEVFEMHVIYMSTAGGQRFFIPPMATVLVTL